MASCRLIKGRKGKGSERGKGPVCEEHMCIEHLDTHPGALATTYENTHAGASNVFTWPMQVHQCCECIQCV
jgi:hypothetical protein